MADDSAFISYRRETGYPWARLLWEGLRERDVDAFLDLESMRSAGRFDDRLLNQIAARPYFVAVLTAGTLERCVSDDDWMRREIEHAIETNRIVVPVFVAPFRPLDFPPELPSHLAAVLSASNGVTLYSQYLAAGFDLLADELLVPVAAPSTALTEDDQRFRDSVEERLRALPLVNPPETPIPDVDPEPPVARTADSQPASPTGPTGAAGGNDEPVGAGDATPEAPPEPAEPAVAAASEAPRSPDDERHTSKRPMILAGIIAVLALALGGVLVGLALGGDDEGAVPTTTSSGQRAVTTSTTPSSTTTLAPGVLRELRRDVPFDEDMSIVSTDNAHRLEMTEGGVVRLVSGRSVAWTLHEDDRSEGTGPFEPVEGAALFVNGDDNLALYSSLDRASADVLWSSDTADEDASGDASLVVVEVEGRPVVRLLRPDGTVIWSANEPSEIDAGGTDGTGDAASETDDTDESAETTTAPETAEDTTDDTTDDTTAPPSTLVAAPANITVGDATVDNEQAVVEVEFKNSGDTPGAIRSVEIDVLRAFWTRVRVGQGDAMSVYDVDVDGWLPGTTCSLDLDWSDIPPTSSTIETRSIAFGGVRSDEADGDRLNWTMELRLTLVVDSEVEEVVERNVTVDVRADSSASAGGRATAICS